MNVFELGAYVVTFAIGYKLGLLLSPTLGVFGWILGFGLATISKCLALW